MKAVIYARYSSDNQREESIENQIRICKEYADKHNHTIVEIYADYAKSGKAMANRDQLLQMLTDAKKKKFELVIAVSIDRISRDRKDHLFIKYDLKKSNIKLEYTEANINDDDPESIILESVLSGFSEYYVANLSRNVKKGHKTNALKALHNGGKPALGYDVDKATMKYVINDDEAVIVREIFRLKSLDYSYGYIIDHCNGRNYKTKAGNNFGKNSLHDLLCNPKYIGMFRYGRIENKNGKRNSHQEPSDDTIEIPNAVPAIIDIETWNTVQEQMSAKKFSPARHKATVEYLLSGKIFCHCGAAMTGHRQSVKRKNGTVDIYPYYICNAKVRLKQCDSKSIPKEKIENLVYNTLVNLLLSTDSVEKLKSELNHQIISKIDQNAVERSKHERDLADAEKALNNLLTLIEQGITDKMIMERYHQQQQKYEIALHNVSKTALQPLFTDGQIERMLLDIRGKEKTPDTVRGLFNRFLERVDVLPDGKVDIKTCYTFECVIRSK